MTAIVAGSTDTPKGVFRVGDNGANPFPHSPLFLEHPRMAAADATPLDATGGPWAPLRLGAAGGARIWPPVVLAPMAGITNAPFRTLCQEQAESATDTRPAGLYVSEMITPRALVERDAKTLRLIRFAETERPRSIQLYGVDPDIVGRAVAMIVDENLAD